MSTAQEAEEVAVVSPAAVSPRLHDQTCVHSETRGIRSEGTSQCETLLFQPLLFVVYGRRSILGLMSIAGGCGTEELQGAPDSQRNR